MANPDKLTTGLAALVAVAVIAMIVGVIATGGDGGASREPASDLGAATDDNVDEEAVVIFRDSCGQCHTLSVAGTGGEIGPNLDEERYDRERVLTAIERGGRGSGQMAPNLIEGAEAEQVADLIAGDEPLR